MAVKFYGDNLNTIYHGDARNMSELPDGCAQMVCTSPPYWGLRKYAGLPDLIWGDGSVTAFGLELTPEMYINHTLEFLREIRRVLRKDGVCFWDIGDSYYSNPSNQQGRGQRGSGAGVAGAFVPLGRQKRVVEHKSLKPKDLCLVPFRVAIAAQEDGWWVRSVIIWAKPNPMPESVTDRPTESHEYILLLTKSRKYYWDAEAVREPARDWGTRDRNNFRASTDDPFLKHRGLTNADNAKAGRNIRSVWEFPTEPPPFPGIHFAAFPEKLPEICIKAATPEVGCCSKCGAPWERVIKHNRPDDYDPSEIDANQQKGTGGLSHNRPLSKIFSTSLKSTIETLGWKPTCNCNADKVPSLVLDPFMGSGTTLWVAKKLGRRAAGYELSAEYCQLALDRNRQMGLGV